MKKLLYTLGVILLTIGATLSLQPAQKADSNSAKQEKIVAELNEAVKQMEQQKKKIEELQAQNKQYSEEQKASNKKDAEAEEKTETVDTTQKKPVAIEKAPAKATARFILTIEDGVRSPDVAQTLYETGFVDDAEAFNAFLTSQGYANRIQLGTYELSPGMTQQDIAKIITKQ